MLDRPLDGDRCAGKAGLPPPISTGYRFATLGCRRTAGKPCLLTIWVYVTSVKIRVFKPSESMSRIHVVRGALISPSVSSYSQPF